MTDSEREHLNRQRDEFEHKRKLMVGSEKQNAFSQALDYLTQIVQLQMPLRTPVYRSRMPSKTFSSKRFANLLNVISFQYLSWPRMTGDDENAALRLKKFELK